MLEPVERVGAVGLFDRPGQAYEAVQDLIDARLPCERIESLIYAGREADEDEIHGDGRYLPFRISGLRSGPAAGDEVSGAAARKCVIEMMRAGKGASSAAEYTDAVLRGGSLVVVDVDEARMAHVEAIFDRYDRMNDPSWNWAWEYGGMFGRDGLPAGLIDETSTPLTIPLQRVGPSVWRHVVLDGRTGRERDEDPDEGDEPWDEDEGIRFPSPERDPPAEIPEDPERPPRQPN